MEPAMTPLPASRTPEDSAIKDRARVHAIKDRARVRAMATVRVRAPVSDPGPIKLNPNP